MNTPALRSWIAALALASSPLALSNSSPSTHAALQLMPCQIQDVAGVSVHSAECGELQVAENPAAPGGRQIKLRVARVPAISRRKSPDPLFLLAGGPGMAATTLYASAAPAFARIRRDRDIVLVDQRGTGESNPLDCDFDDESLLSASAAELTAETRQCLDTLSKRADVAFYTTSLAVQDLDRVRAALGYERINLYGGSYGTRVAEHYLRRFPGHTRTVILDGVVSPELALGPNIALDAENALIATLTRCARDPDCSKRFGDPVETYQALRKTLDTRPVAVTYTHPTTGERTSMEFGPMHFATVLRLSIYTSEQAAVLPLMLHLAQHSGNFEPLAGQFAMMLRTYTGAIAYGMHNSVVCTEDVPFYKPQDIDREQLARTFMGVAQLDALRTLCETWPRGPMDADLHAPLDSDVPVLLLSGGNDPVTPPQYANEARIGLRNNLHLTQPDLGHGQIGVPCMGRVMADFVRLGTVQGLDASCAKRAKPMPFFISPGGPPP